MVFNLEFLAGTLLTKQVPRATWTLAMTMLITFIAQMAYLNEHMELLSVLWYVPDQPTVMSMISSLFLHDWRDLLHLLGNLIVLLSVGPAVEARLGGWRFLALFFICGIAGNLAETVTGITDPTIGASGAIFGVAAAYMILWFREGRIFSLLWFAVIPFPIPVVLPASIALGVRFAMELWQVLFPVPTDATAHILHVAGFLVGAGIALLYRFRLLGKTLAVPQFSYCDIPDVRTLAGWAWQTLLGTRK